MTDIRIEWRGTECPDFIQIRHETGIHLSFQRCDILNPVANQLVVGFVDEIQHPGIASAVVFTPYIHESRAAGGGRAIEFALGR
jgi:hypothetical protein